MAELSDLRWLQGVFSTLVGLFDRVGLKTNVGNTVVMVCLPCLAVGTQLEAAYGQRVTGAGPSYRERHIFGVKCSECGEEVAPRSLSVHQQTQHGKAMGGIWYWETTAPRKKLSGSPSQPPGYRRTAPLRGVRDGRRRGKRCVFISSTDMSGMPSSYWRRETSPAHGVPNATC